MAEFFNRDTLFFDRIMTILLLYKPNLKTTIKNSTVGQERMHMNAEIKDYIDIESALARMRGNKTLYAKMLGLFFAGNDLTELEAAVAENALDKAQSIAHAIKGVAGNLSLTALYDESAALMQTLRRGELDPQRFEEFCETYSETRSLVPEVTALIHDK
jgi:HPt (histidine-containing phosphotransfer) domain-containing protein